ncbi:MAG TPA: alpha/beta fold hydrolase [Novosphingobium sp.]|nr:alpha/beta fold hydrolase [Novosphingobium sp.]
MDCEITIYLHGVPGSPAELALARTAAPGWFVPDRNEPALGTSLDDRLAELARRIGALHPDAKLHLVGFSLGAMIALRLAPLLGARVSRIDLISAAAPLEGGDFLPDMAGRAVFGLARRAPGLFALLARAQSCLARIAPRWLTRQLFATAQGEDLALARSEAFVDGIAAILRGGLGRSSLGYRAEIAGYVQPWADRLAQVSAPVTLWQGSADNWTPPEMAEYLAQRLPNVVAVHRLEGRSHYSALGAALARL